MRRSSLVLTAHPEAPSSRASISVGEGRGVGAAAAATAASSAAAGAGSATPGSVGPSPPPFVLCDPDLREGTTMTVKVDEVEALGKFVTVSRWCFWHRVGVEGWRCVASCEGQLFSSSCCGLACALTDLCFNWAVSVLWVCSLYPDSEQGPRQGSCACPAAWKLITLVVLLHCRVQILGKDRDKVLCLLFRMKGRPSLHTPA